MSASYGAVARRINKRQLVGKREPFGDAIYSVRPLRAE